MAETFLDALLAEKRRTAVSTKILQDIPGQYNGVDRVVCPCLDIRFEKRLDPVQCLVPSPEFGRCAASFTLETWIEMHCREDYLAGFRSRLDAKKEWLKVNTAKGVEIVHDFQLAMVIETLILQQ